MKFDLIDVEKKPNKKKIILIVLIDIAIVIMAFLIVHYINKIIKVSNKEILEPIEIIESNGNDGAEETNEIKLPTLTEVGKKNVKNIYKQEEKVAYLTFDDGPTKSVTPLILDILKEENVKAVFFVLGSKVDLYPNIVKRAYEEGHYIANHGYTHKYEKIYKNAKSVLNEYKKTEKSIQEAIGVSDYSSHLFRFPGGSTGGSYAKIKKEAKKLLEENNIVYVDWNALTEDSVGNPTKKEMMNKLKGTIKDKKNVVILLHDKTITCEILPDIIKYLREQGFTFGDFYNIIQ